MNKYYIFFLLLTFFSFNTQGKIVYVDSSLTDLQSDTLIKQYNFEDTVYYTDKYDPATRKATSGSFRAFNTILHAFISIQPGDSILMRKGTYTEKINFVDYRKFSETKRGYLGSYPNEWAIINGSIIFRGPNTSSVKYWTFERFEISKGCISIKTARYNTFRELYIHDNPVGVSGDEFINSGIVFNNIDGTAQDNLITHCWLFNNGDANIKFFGDYYSDPKTVDSSMALMRNEISYNYLNGSNHNIHYKNPQFLCRDHEGIDKTLSSFGDKIHHNHIVNATNGGLFISQDFIQVYNNVFENVLVQLGNRYASKREPFYNYIYNNLFIESTLTINHNNSTNVETYYIDSSSTDSLHPYFTAHNNIFINKQPSTTRPIELLYCEVGAWTIKNIALSTISIEKNLFYPLTSGDRAIMIGYKKDLFTIDQLNGLNISENGNYAGITKSLFLSDNTYQINTTYSLSDGLKVNNGGNNVDKYLEGKIKMPKYIGPFSSNTDMWLDSLLPQSYIKGNVPLYKSTLPVVNKYLNQKNSNNTHNRNTAITGCYNVMGRQLTINNSNKNHSLKLINNGFLNKNILSKF